LLGFPGAFRLNATVPCDIYVCRRCVRPLLRSARAWARALLMLLRATPFSYTKTNRSLWMIETTWWLSAINVAVYW
jgi:hypothetical protein